MPHQSYPGELSGCQRLRQACQMCLKSSRSYFEDQTTRLAQLMASGKHQDMVGAVLAKTTPFSFAYLSF